MYKFSLHTLNAKIARWLVNTLPKVRGRDRIIIWFNKNFLKEFVVNGEDNTQLLLTSDSFVASAILKTGSQEPQSLALAKKIMQGGGVFVDVGANIGLYSCSVGNLKDVKCISVEPSYQAYKWLKRNFLLNPAVHYVAANVAISNQSKLMSFFPANEQNLGSTRIDLDNEQTNADILATTTLQELLTYINWSPIKLVKVDIEGHELEAFRYFDFNSKYRPQNMIIEFSQLSTSSFDEFLVFFRNQNYQCLNVDGKKVEKIEDVIELNLWFKSN